MKVLYKKELSAMLAALLVTGMGYSVTAAEGDTNSSANGGAVVAEKAAAATLTADDLKKQLDKAGIKAGNVENSGNVISIGTQASVIFDKNYGDANHDGKIDISGIGPWNAIAIGQSAAVKNSANAIGIGGGAGGGETVVDNSVAAIAIGNYSQVYNKSLNSVALGAFSTVNGESGVISVGHKAKDLYPLDSTGKDTYGSDLFRRVINVADGKDAHDAATVGQLNGYVAYDTNTEGIDKGSVSFGGVNGSGTELKNVNGITFKGTNNNMILTGTAGGKAQVKNAGSSIVLSTLGGGAGQDRPQTTISDTNEAISIGNSNTVTVDKNSATYKNNQPHWFNGNVAIGTQVELTNAGESVGLGSATEVKDSIASTAVGYASKVDHSTYASALGTHTSVTNSDRSVAVGPLAKVDNSMMSVAIGQGAASLNGNYNVALGSTSAVHKAYNSVALGSNSIVADGQSKVISVGHKKGDVMQDGKTTYDDDLFRKITNVDDGKDNHDAATVGQVNAGFVAYDKNKDDSVNVGAVTFKGATQKVNGTDVNVGTKLNNVNDISIKVPVYEQVVPNWDSSKLVDGKQTGYESRSFVSAGLLPGKTSGNTNIALGRTASTKGSWGGAVIIGDHASNEYDKGYIKTPGTNENPNDAIVVGTQARAYNSSQGLTIGTYSETSGSNWGVAIGGDTHVNNSRFGAAFGAGAIVQNAAGGLALGDHSQVKAPGSVALGAGSVVFNSDLKDTDKNGVVSVGSGNAERRIINVADGVNKYDAVNKGQLDAVDTKVSGLTDGAVLYDKKADGTTDYNSVTLKGKAWEGTVLKNVGDIELAGKTTYGQDLSYAKAGITPGYGSDLSKSGIVSLRGSATAMNAIAIGSDAFASQLSSISIGTRAMSQSEYGVAIGEDTWIDPVDQNAKDKGDIGSVALGANSSVSKADTKNGTIGVVSVGSGEKDRGDNTRKIINVTDGTVAKDSHDAVTGGQLYTVQQKADNSVQYDDAGQSSVTFGGGEKGTALKNVNDLVFNVAYQNAYGFDKQGTFSFVDAGVIPGKVLTTGKDNFALGTDAVIGYDTSEGSAQSDRPAPNYNVVVGNHAAIDGGVSSSVVIGNSASAKNWKANEDGTYPELKKIVAIGQAATADHSNATSIGASASVGGTNGTALGAETEARADNSTAVGGKVMINSDAENSVAIGGDSYSEPNGTGSIQYNKTEVAYGAANSTIVGVGAYSQAKYGTSLGADTRVSSENGLALGAHASVNFSGKNSVALGANSEANEENVVSVGNAENNLQRKVVNVANGKVAKDSHDAVTGGQLYDVSQKVTDLDSLAVKYDSEDRNTVTFTNGTTLKNVNDIEVNVKGGSRGLVSSGITPGTVYATANGWKEGAAADTASLAIGGGLQNSQTTSATVRGKNSIAIGSGATVDATAQELDAPLNGFDNADGVAIGVGANVSGIQGTAVGYGATVKENQGTAFGNQSAANGNKATAIGFIAVAEADNATALGQGASVGTGADNSIALGAGSVVFNSDLKDTDKNGVVSVGSGNAERRIIHVADGTVSENSKDAVNGGQLYAVDAKVTGLASNAVQYDSVDKSSVTFKGANGTTLSNVADIALVPYKGHASTFVGSGLVNGVVYDTTANSAWTENGSEKTSSIAIGRGSNVRGTSSLALGTGATVGTGDNSTVIANGTALGSNAKAGGQNGTAVGEEATVAGDNGAAFGYQAKADVDSTAIGTNATAGYNGAGESVAIGKSANAQYAQGVAIGNKAEILADQGTALGYGANVTWNGKNSVALGAGSIANEENVISVGRAAGQGGNVSNPAITRRIVNVADGQNATDAATVGQLNQKISEATQNSVKWDNGSKNTINGVQLSGGKVTADKGISAGNGNFNVDNSGNVSIGKDDKVTINSSTGDIKTSGTIYTKDGEVASKTYVDDKISGVTTDVTELKGQVSQNRKNIATNTANIAQNQKDIAANKNAIETNTENIGDVKKYEDKKNGFTDVNNVVDATIANRKTIGDGKLDNGAADLTSGINQNYKYIQQNRDAIGQLGTRVNKLGSEVDSVGAISSALAGLHPLSYNPGDARYQLSAAVGTYDGTQALALGGFYNINKDVLLSLGLSSDLNGEHKTAGNLGITFRVGSGTSQAYQPATPGVGNDILQRLAAMDQKISDLEAENEDLKNQVKALKNAQATK